MKKSICKFPKCTKETFDVNALFCGEHEREFKDFKGKIGKAASGMAIFAMTFIAKKLLEKNFNIWTIDLLYTVFNIFRKSHRNTLWRTVS